MTAVGVAGAVDVAAGGLGPREGGVRLTPVAAELVAMSTDAAGATGDEPVVVTPTAAEEALSLMADQGMDESVGGLRLYVQQGGCAGLSYGMRFENEPESDDAVTNHHGLRVFVDPASEEYIAGSTLDYESGLQAAGFHVDNPNVVSECGCGESFRT